MGFSDPVSSRADRMPDGFGFGEIPDGIGRVVDGGEPVGIRREDFDPFHAGGRALLERSGLVLACNGGDGADVLVGGECR